MSPRTEGMVVEREFSSDEAGERVGWSAVCDYGSEDAYKSVRVATATVGPQGAHLAHERRGDEKIYWDNASEGFIAVTGLTVVLDQAKDPLDQEVAPYFVPGKNKSDESYIWRVGGGTAGVQKNIESDREWSSDASNLVITLKQQMEARGLGNYFPLVYYTANVIMTHEAYWTRSVLRQVPQVDLILPDRDMHETTREQRAIAESLRGTLMEQYDRDGEMLRDLGVSSEIPADQVSVAFKESRQKQAEAEKRVTELRKRLMTFVGVYLPVGFRPNGRTWSYMDTTEPDESKAFGLELAALSQGNVGPAEKELTREMDELKKRAEFAAQGVRSLQILSDVESNLA